jgi:hypothetical protein
MTYKVNRAIGYRKWGVTNPWVFANYGQPQRHRGYISPMVFQTSGPFLQSAHLGSYIGAYEAATEAERELLRQAGAETRRAERMETLAITGLGLSLVSLWFSWQFLQMRKSTPNRRRARKGRRQ